MTTTNVGQSPETQVGFFAHSLPPPHTIAEWEPLGKHLRDVSRMAAEFASGFGAAEWGAVAGRWHDLGKYSREFQEYLKSSSDPDAAEESLKGRVDHSTFGARYARDKVGKHKGQLLAYCIAGHHAGLPNAYSTEVAEERSTLEFRLNDKKIFPVNLPEVETALPELAFPFVPSGLRGFQIAFFTRMIFSALIDADRLATESFCNQAQSAERLRRKPTIREMVHVLNTYLEQKQFDARKTAVNQVRAKVLAACKAASDLVPGFFSLNVPTGGGKTLSSLMFSLRHALAHDLGRIIVAVPFTTIIEQTADAYRKALGGLAEHALIEHHSNISPEIDTRQNKLAAENWDAPLIVTTNVQVYESLFSSATSPCRKLHRLARSVIVLDEAQTIPVEFLHPTLAALRELVNHYGCTVVLCTATQPALERRDGFDIGIETGAVRPIVRTADELFGKLRRVSIRHVGKLADEPLADRLSAEKSVLCIVNTRRQASKVYNLLAPRVNSECCLHLSTWMCAEHRRNVLDDVRQRLKGGEACRLISTQLIEAGVDIDFPCVYRATAGFDSIAQAAGRCNREGLLTNGRVYIFDAETLPPAGLLRQAAQAAAELAEHFEDPLSLAAVEAYFRLFYWSQKHNWDRKGVLAQFDDDLRDPKLRLQFREAAARYKLIVDEQVPVLVPYNDEARAMRSSLLHGEPADFTFRRLAQRYIVTVWPTLLAEMVKRHAVIENESGLWLLLNEDAYTAEKGLCLEAAGIHSELLIA